MIVAEAVWQPFWRMPSKKLDDDGSSNGGSLDGYRSPLGKLGGVLCMYRVHSRSRYTSVAIIRTSVCTVER